MSDFDRTYVIIGSQEMIWESLADDGYVTEFLKKNHVKEGKHDKIHSLIISGTEAEGGHVLKVKNLFHLLETNQSVGLIMIVEDIAITTALLILAKYQEYADHIADILVMNAAGDFVSIFGMAERI